MGFRRGQLSIILFAWQRIMWESGQMGHQVTNFGCIQKLLVHWDLRRLNTNNSTYKWEGSCLWINIRVVMFLSYPKRELPSYNYVYKQTKCRLTNFQGSKLGLVKFQHFVLFLVSMRLLTVDFDSTKSQRLNIQIQLSITLPYHFILFFY